MKNFVVKRSAKLSNFVLGGGVLFTLYFIFLYLIRALNLGQKAINSSNFFSITLPLLFLFFFCWRFASAWLIALRSRKRDLLLMTDDYIGYREMRSRWELHTIPYAEIKSIYFDSGSVAKTMNIELSDGMERKIVFTKEFPSQGILCEEILKRANKLSKKTDSLLSL